MIIVSTTDATVDHPLNVTMIDASGAHVVLTVTISGLPPLSHAFSYYEGSYTGVVDKLTPGRHACSFTVQAYKYEALNGKYDAILQINGQTISHVVGLIPPGQGADSGMGVFSLDVRR